MVINVSRLYSEYLYMFKVCGTSLLKKEKILKIQAGFFNIYVNTLTTEFIYFNKILSIILQFFNKKSYFK